MSAESYANTCDANRKNGQKGGRPKSQHNPKKPNGLNVNPKKPDSDSDSDSDSEKTSEDRSEYLTRGNSRVKLGGEMSEGCDMCKKIDRLASRHIAKLLTKLGSTCPPVIEQEIKRQFRFFSNDIISVIGGDSNEQDDDRFNR